MKKKTYIECHFGTFYYIHDTEIGEEIFRAILEQGYEFIPLRPKQREKMLKAPEAFKIWFSKKWPPAYLKKERIGIFTGDGNRPGTYMEVHFRISDPEIKWGNFSTLEYVIEEPWLRLSNHLQCYLAIAKRIYEITNSAFGYIQSRDLIEYESLERCLQGPYWANFYGPEYVEMFGKKKVETMPCYKLEWLPDGGALVLLCENPFDFDTEENRKKAKAIKKHLGRRYFYRRFLPTYVPRFRFKSYEVVETSAETLLKAVSREDEESAWFALDTLGRKKVKEAAPALVKMLEERRNKSSASYIALVLSEIGDERALPVLEDILKDEHYIKPDERKYVIWTIKRIKGEIKTSLYKEWPFSP